jgi:hypothetical protein
MATQADTFAQILRAIASILSPPTKIKLALPVITRKGIAMPNYELEDDLVYTIPILTDDTAGNPVAPPPGDAFTAVSSLPASLGAAINGANLVVTPLVQEHLNPAAPAAPDLFVTVSDSAGLSSYIQVFDIVADLTPKAISLNLAGATTQSQPVPAAPGP